MPKKNIDVAIPTYFSHSYRQEDQKLNAWFWRLFERHGFYFSVDPPSNTNIHTHLERMMHRSSCYVAILNRRDDILDPPFCSRFILYELNLALQARRPHLLLIDRKIHGGTIDKLPEDVVHNFDPARLEAGEAKLIDKIEALRKCALPVKDFTSEKRGPIGLLLPRGRGDKLYGGAAAQEQIERAASRHGFGCKPIFVPHESNADFALDLEECEAVILGVRADKLPPWVFAYVHGRLIPSLKLVRVGKNEAPHILELPPLVKGLQMDKNEPAVESLIYWRTPDDLIHQLSKGFEKLDEDPTELRKEQQGERYFKSIGRRPARVFISNAGVSNPLAQSLSNELRLDNIERFQYRDEKAIKTGSEWQKKLEHELMICQVFVALLGKGYAESKWCMKELRTALRREGRDLKVLPYHVDNSDISDIERRYLQRIHVTGLQRDTVSQVTRIVEDIQEHLTTEDDATWAASHFMLQGGSKEVVIDALRQISPEAWKSLAGKLRDAGITVSTGTSQTQLRKRQIAEQLLLEVQRAITPQGAQSPLTQMVCWLKQHAAPQHRDVLESIVIRLNPRIDQ